MSEENKNKLFISNRDRKAKDGLTHNCRECRKIAAREYRKSLK